MTELAIRYRRRTTRHEVQAAVPKGTVTRLHVPDEDAKAHLVTAVLKARCEPDEELELFGESAARLAPARRETLRARVGAVSPIVGLITNLNAWENISLPAAYHGSPPLEQVATLAHEPALLVGDHGHEGGGKGQRDQQKHVDLQYEPGKAARRQRDAHESSLVST